jgi:toxin ParE1/3/4
MRKKILARAKAAEDIYEQALYIARDNLKAAERYALTVEKTIASLAENPKRGALYKSRAVRLKGLRKLPVPGFKDLIFYLESADTIEVVRILHGARDLPNILNKPFEG